MPFPFSHTVGVAFAAIALTACTSKKCPAGQVASGDQCVVANVTDASVDGAAPCADAGACGAKQGEAVTKVKLVSDSNETGALMAADGLGHIYVAGNLKLRDQTSIVQQYNNAGDITSRTSYRVPAVTRAGIAPTSLIAPDADSVFISGEYFDAVEVGHNALPIVKDKYDDEVADHFVARITSGGTVVWIKTFGTWLYRVNPFQTSALAVDDQNHLYIGATVSTDKFAYPGFSVLTAQPYGQTRTLMRVDSRTGEPGPDGWRQIWKEGFCYIDVKCGFTSLLSLHANTLLGSAVGYLGALGIPGGAIDRGIGGQDAALFSVAPQSGAAHWMKAISSSSDDLVFQLLKRSTGEIIALGSRGQDPWLAKVDPDSGVLVWERNFPSLQGHIHSGYVAADDSIYVTGTFRGFLDVGGGTTVHLENMFRDIFAMHLDGNDGHVLAYWTWGSVLNDHAQGIVPVHDSPGSFWVLAEIGGPTDFGSGLPIDVSGVALVMARVK